MSFLMEIDTANKESWDEGLAHMADGVMVEVTEEVYDYFLGTGPPLRIRNGSFIVAEPVDTNRHHIFFRTKNKFYGFIGEIQCNDD